MKTLEEYSTDELILELQKRELKNPLSATLEISGDKVTFNIKKLTWPQGTYNVDIIFKEKTSET